MLNVKDASTRVVEDFRGAKVDVGNHRAGSNQGGVHSRTGGGSGRE